MRRSFLTQLLYAIVVIVLFLSGMANAQESYDGTYQISELMDAARDNFDLSREDAVLLLDSDQGNFVVYTRNSGVLKSEGVILGQTLSSQCLDDMGLLGL